MTTAAEQPPLEEDLPERHRAIVLASIRNPPDFTLQKHLPTPHPTPGSVVIRVLAAAVPPNTRALFTGQRAAPYPTPFVPGSSAIGRVAAAGPDATVLQHRPHQPGQLVFADSFLRARDDPAATFLCGAHEGFTPGGRALAGGTWRDGSYAEYWRVPLEACHALDETALQPLEYSAGELAALGQLLVPFGGLRDAGVGPGERVGIAPATGFYGGAAVRLALALGARVVAVGRNVERLGQLGRMDGVRVMRITGDVQADSAELRRDGLLDVFLDISPAEAAESTHLESGILALRRGGRVSLMGGQERVSIPHSTVRRSCLQLRGKQMYESEDVKALIRLVETGVVKLGGAAGFDPVEAFGLAEFESALNAASESRGFESQTVITP